MTSSFWLVSDLMLTFDSLDTEAAQFARLYAQCVNLTSAVCWLCIRVLSLSLSLSPLPDLTVRTLNWERAKSEKEICLWVFVSHSYHSRSVNRYLCNFSFLGTVRDSDFNLWDDNVIRVWKVELTRWRIHFQEDFSQKTGQVRMIELVKVCKGSKRFWRCLHDSLQVRELGRPRDLRREIAYSRIRTRTCMLHVYLYIYVKHCAGWCVCVCVCLFKSACFSWFAEAVGELKFARADKFANNSDNWIPLFVWWPSIFIPT